MSEAVTARIVRPSSELTSHCKSLSGDVSPVFGRLIEFIDYEYSSFSSDTRSIIFALAYTEYCRRKKEFIMRALEDDDERRDYSIKRAHLQLDRDDDFRDYSERALALFETVRQELLEEIISAISGNIVGDLVPSLEDIDERLETIESHSKSHGGYIRRTFMHSIEIVVAAFWLVAIWWGGSIVLPFIGKQATKYLPFLEGVSLPGM